MSGYICDCNRGPEDDRGTIMVWGVDPSLALFDGGAVSQLILTCCTSRVALTQEVQIIKGSTRKPRSSTYAEALIGDWYDPGARTRIIGDHFAKRMQGAQRQSN